MYLYMLAETYNVIIDWYELRLSPELNTGSYCSSVGSSSGSSLK